MNLFIAQMVSLVTNYNDYISTGNIPKNYLESGVFDDCETVGFILVRNFVTRSHFNGDLVGANPVRWFKYLEKDDCLKLALHFDSKRDKQNESETISPYINGTLYIEAVYKSYSNFWHCKWYKQGESSTEYKWNIRYYLPFRFENTVNSIINFTTAAERLREVLNKCMQFTMDNDFLQWSQTCSIAIKVLESTEPQTVFNKSAVINNDRYPLNVRRMIYSTLIAFMHPDENLWTIQYKKEEDKVMLAKLRDEFYEALINGLMAAINLQR
jgi:hypothetical protein